MAIRNVREDGDEVLRKKSRTIEVVDEKIKELAQDLLDTMYKYNGVGLAAPQVGLLKRIVVIDIEDGHGPYVLINPEIIKEKGEQEVDEGCLSFPNKFAKVIRPAELTVKFTNLDGKTEQLKAKDFLAQAISHEVDHLEGILFVDKMIPGTLEVITPEPEDGKNKNKKKK